VPHLRIAMLEKVSGCLSQTSKTKAQRFGASDLSPSHVLKRNAWVLDPKSTAHESCGCMYPAIIPNCTAADCQ
jgi:nitrate reductase cytochrome c-type subunit